MPAQVSYRRARPDKRPDIIARATRAFSVTGYSAASLREIGETVGVTPASLYHHFDSKEDLLRSIIMEGCDHLSTVLMAALAQDRAVEDKLYAVIRVHLNFCWTYADQNKVVIEESRFLKPLDLAAVREKQRGIVSIYRTCLRQLRGDRSGDAAMATMSLQIISVINGFARWYRADGPLALTDAIEQTISFIKGGVDARLSTHIGD